MPYPCPCSSNAYRRLQSDRLPNLRLQARRTASLKYGESDPRFGIPAGQDDALHAVDPLSAIQNRQVPPVHWYGAAAELYRACAEMGRVWSAVGRSWGRTDVAAHGADLVALAPQIYAQLHKSLNRTVTRGATRCWAKTAAAPSLDITDTPETLPATFRGFAEMMYSGALTAGQVSDIYAGAAGTACGDRLVVLGSPALNGASISTPTPYGLAHGLLQHDMVEKFLLHFFAMSAHAYTRGSWTTPESANVVDRDAPTVAFAAAGEVIVPTYLKWMLCFEEPETKTLWLGKAVPRDWLAPGEAPLVASNLTTRYGRVSYGIAVAAATAGGGSDAAGYAVTASVTLPASFADAATAPAGGLRLRIRAPAAHAGRLSGVTIGGKAWAGFSAAEETIDIAAGELTPELIHDGLPRIVATFAGPQVLLRPALIGSRR